MRIAVDANTILSGLFFSGSERRLLLQSLQGTVTLLLAEDVVDEVYEVMAGERFRGRAALPEALELLGAILAAGEPVRREDYANNLDHWLVRLRDPSDAPLLACVAAAGADGVVSGDRDVLQLRGTEGLRVYRTKEILRRLSVD